MSFFLLPQEIIDQIIEKCNLTVKEYLLLEQCCKNMIFFTEYGWQLLLKRKFKSIIIDFKTYAYREVFLNLHKAIINCNIYCKKFHEEKESPKKAQILFDLYKYLCLDEWTLLLLIHDQNIRNDLKINYWTNKDKLHLHGFSFPKTILDVLQSLNILDPIQ